MGLNVEQFSKYIVRPVLQGLGLYSLAAERLLIGTALAEGGLHYIDQVERGGDKKPGPAYGVYQMERATHEDLWDNFLKFKPQIVDRINFWMCGGRADCEMMHGNLYYATAMCRVHYLRSRRPLPAEADPVAMSEYHKVVYNTYLGAANPAKNVIHFKTAIEQVKP